MPRNVRQEPICDRKADVLSNGLGHRWKKSCFLKHSRFPKERERGREKGRKKNECHTHNFGIEKEDNNLYFLLLKSSEMDFMMREVKLRQSATPAEERSRPFSRSSSSARCIIRWYSFCKIPTWFCIFSFSTRTGEKSSSHGCHFIKKRENESCKEIALKNCTSYNMRVELSDETDNIINEKMKVIKRKL